MSAGRRPGICCERCSGFNTIARPVAAPAVTARRFSRPAIVAAAALAVVVLGFTGLSFTRPSAPAAARISFPIHPPEGTKFPRGTAEMALSPDGNRLVFVALAADGTRHLWVRRFDAVESRLIEGSEDAHYPFWSPDGSSIAYFAHNKLKRIAEAGGVPQDDLRCRAGHARRDVEQGWRHPVQQFRAAIAAGAGHGWSADARQRAQSIA